MRKWYPAIAFVLALFNVSVGYAQNCELYTESIEGKIIFRIGVGCDQVVEIQNADHTIASTVLVNQIVTSTPQPVDCNSAIVINSTEGNVTYIRSSAERINGVNNNWLGKVLNNYPLTITGEDGDFWTFTVTGWIDSEYVDDDGTLIGSPTDNGTRIRTGHSTSDQIMAILFDDAQLILSGQSYEEVGIRIWIQGTLTGYIGKSYQGLDLVELACG